MHVLFTSWAWPSHLYAMVPLAWACRAAGHEVRFASQPALADEIVHTGLTAVPVGHDVDSAAMVRGFVLPPDATGPGSGGAAAPGPPARRGPPRALAMFRANAEAVVADLVGYARRWRPDLVVYEPTAFAGPVVAAAVGVPAVRHLFGTDLMYRAREATAELLAELGARVGATPGDPLGVATVDPCPPGLQVTADYPRIPMRYVPYNGSGAEPADVPQGTVCVTAGHTMAKLGPQYFLPGMIARALAGLELTVAVSARQRPLLGDLGDPGTTTVVESVPLHLVLPGQRLVVAHGGAGTVLTALRSGVPLLLIPQLPDHAGHARHVVQAGAGEVLSRAAATPEALRAAVDRLLDDRAVLESARELRRQMLDQPPPAAVVGTLERIAASGAPPRREVVPVPAGAVT